MSGGYTPALEVTVRTRVRKLRELPLLGECLVEIGDSVEANTDVLKADLPGDLTIVRVADRMGLEPEDVLSGMKVSSGGMVERGQTLCEVKTFFNLFTTTLESPSSGEIEFFTEANTHMGIRHEPTSLFVSAYLSGTVIDLEEGKTVTIETDGALIQGIFGVGGEGHGVLYPLPVAPDALVTKSDLQKIPDNLSGAILIGGAQLDYGALEEAASRSVAGVVTGSIDAGTLLSFVGEEIGVAITGDEEVPFTLITTEGFGFLSISERVLKLAERFKGYQASLTGATQVRAGAMRPEVIIPLTEADRSEMPQPVETSYTLEPGSRIRVIRVPYFGALGTVSTLPHEPQTIPSGASVRVLKAKLDSGEEVIVPRANVELL